MEEEGSLQLGNINVNYLYLSTTIAHYGVESILNSVTNVLYERELLSTTPKHWINQLLSEIYMNISLLNK